MKKLILPGWRNSGPGHWQTRWEQLDKSFARVEQLDWEAPTLFAWHSQLDAALTEPSVLVAHSLGCLLAIHARRSVQAALLVAPPWLEGMEAFASFWPPPKDALPYPSVLVASSDDVYCNADSAKALARAWGSRFVDAGPRGHLNEESNLGDWPEGRQLLEELLA